MDTVEDMEPIVLGIHPRTGWRNALGWQRVGAVGMVVLLVLVGGWWSLMDEPEGMARLMSLVLAVAASLLGPLCHWSAARILRPYPPGVGAERRVRHWVAAVGGSWGSYVILLLSTGADWDASGMGSVWVWWVMGASFAGSVSALWGLVALVVRSGRIGAVPVRPVGLGMHPSWSTGGAG